MNATKVKYVFVLICSMFCLCVDSSAQSIPILSDPIKVQEFELMSNRLDLTLAQQEAAIDVYDGYIDQFAQVKLGEIKDFEDSIGSAAETFGFMQFSIPERDLVEELIRKAQRAMRGIQRVDAQFFEELSGMLSDNQKVNLDRQEMARKLQAYELVVLGMMGEMNRGARGSIRKYVNELDIELDRELQEALDIYDQRYLAETESGFDSMIMAVRLGLDQIDEIGVRGVSQQELAMRFMADPEAIEDLKRRGEILIKPLMDQAYKLSQVNWKTWNRIRNLLDAESAYKLQKRYFGRSFRDAVRGGSKTDGYIERALSLDSLSESQKIDLQELEKQFRIKWSKDSRKYAEVIENSRKKRTIAMEMGDEPNAFESQLLALKDKRASYVETVENRVDSILGSDLVAELKDASRKKDELKWQSAERIEGGYVVTGETEHSQLHMPAAEEIDPLFEEDVKQEALAGGATIPEPIAPSFSARASKIFNFDITGEVIIQAVYDEYREKYAEARDAIVLKSKMIDSDSELSQARRMRDIREASEEASNQVALLDVSFFDDLATVISLDREDLNLKMLEHHRSRQRNATPDNPFSWRGGEGDTIDIVALYVMSKEGDELQEGIGQKSRNAMQKAMQSYHDQVSDEHEKYVESLLNLERLQEAMYLFEDEQQNERMAESIRKRWQDAYTSVRDSKRAFLLANQTFVESLLSSIPEEDYWTIRTGFVKKAYPEVFQQSSDATPMLTVAQSLPTLNQIQIGKLDSLSNDYRYDFWNISEAMIATHQLSASAESGDGMMNKGDIDRMLSLETLRFQRRELKNRIEMRLRMILNEDQIKEVPGLRPSVAPASEWRWGRR